MTGKPMAQNARIPQKRAYLLLALAFTLPSLAAQACDCPPRHREPIVLNGRLDMSGFTGGVGYGADDGGYMQASVYVAGGANAGAGAFAAARAQAFASAHASASAHGFGGGHMGSGHGMGGYGGHH
jgi:hypothetical protein